MKMKRIKVKEEIGYREDKRKNSKVHFIHKCECGEIVVECECRVKEKRVTVVKGKCDKCREEEENS